MAVCACGRATAVQVEAFGSEKGDDAVCVPLKEPGHRLQVKPQCIGTFHFHPPQHVLLHLGVDTAWCSGLPFILILKNMLTTAQSFPAWTKAKLQISLSLTDPSKISKSISQDLDLTFLMLSEH